MLLELNEESFNKEIQEGLKLIDFYTTWCGYCQKQQLVLDEMSQNGIWIGKIDCDKFPSIAKKYGITGFPTILLFKNGKNLTQLVGYHTKSQLLDRLTAFMN